MKRNTILRKFALTIVALGIFLVLLWGVFYYLIVEVYKRTLITQAEVASDAILAQIEDDLLKMDDTAVLISNYEGIAEIADAKTDRQFLKECSEFAEKAITPVADLHNFDGIVMFRYDGVFCRLKGKISNATLHNLHRQRTLFRKNSIYITGAEKYIGEIEPLFVDDREVGYVAILMDQNRLKMLFDNYKDMEYLKIILLDDSNQILCASSSYETDTMPEDDDFLFCKEKNIGLTGLRLVVICENQVSFLLSRYYVIMIPIMICCLSIVLLMFLSYVRKHMLDPINSVITNADSERNMPLPATGEEYFDGLVTHVNEMLERIEEKDRQLYDSKIQIKEAELEKERTLLTLLKKQINAHFTVNTLNVIRALINMGKKQEAAHICDELSTLLRYANAGEEDISLMEEIYMLEQYAGIMQARYPGKFEFVAEPKDFYEDVRIPRMLLQPLVENAILYGFADRSGTITLDANLRDNDILIEVSDNGKGMSEEELEKVRDRINVDFTTSDMGITHIALANINHRIQMACGEECGVSISSESDKGTTVLLWLKK